MTLAVLKHTRRVMTRVLYGDGRQNPRNSLLRLGVPLIAGSTPAKDMVVTRTRFLEQYE